MILQRHETGAALRILLLALLAAPSAFGQATATLVGSVADPLGEPLSSARIELSNRLTGFARQAQAGDDGRFQLTNIPFHGYELRIAADGFATHREEVSLRTNVPTRLTIRLEIEAQHEALDVSVTGRATLIDPEVTGTRTELHRSAIERLPLPAGVRGIEAALLNLPGFAANANGAIHPRGAHNQMTYVVDGMPISDQFTGSFATSIDPNLVQSLEVFTGDVPPEYGAKVSGVANITTRSGLDAGGRTFGQFEMGGGGFDTLSTAAQAGGTLGRVGYFASLSALKSNRFLDSPSLDNLHNGGNAERAFVRLDGHPGSKDFLRFSMMTGRSSFQLANLRSQHENGQQQRRLLRDAAFSLGWVRTLDPATTFDSTTSYRTTIAQLFPSAGDTPVTASLARHLSTFSTFNRVNVDRGRHRFRAGVDYQRFPVSENFFFGLTDPGFNDPAADGFNENVLPFDLTRGGDWFRFSDKAAGDLFSVFMQDRLRVGRFIFNVGGRYDVYRFLVRGNQLQPRLGMAYHLEETGTVFRISYNRNYQTPPNENLLLSNSPASAALAPPEVRRELNGGLILMRPQRENVYEAGLQQRLGDWASFDAVYFHKNSRDLQDNDNFLDTGIIFPTSLAFSRINGFETRLVVPERRGISGSVSLTHSRTIVTPPFTGGLFLDEDALEDLVSGPFVIDHDQPLAVSTVVTWRPARNWWTTWQARYDFGLVTGPSDAEDVALDPDFSDMLPLVRLDRDPPRVNPRTIVDAAIGYERGLGDRTAWEAILQVSNLFDKTALYNFQSPFVGTRVVQPRAASLKLRWRW